MWYFQSPGLQQEPERYTYQGVYSIFSPESNMPYRQDIYLEAKIKWNALFQTKPIDYEVKLSIMDSGILESQVE